MTRRKTRRLLRRTASQVRAAKASAFRYPHSVYRSRFALRDYIRWAAGIPCYYAEREDDFAPVVHQRDVRRGRSCKHARTHECYATIDRAGMLALRAALAKVTP